MGSFIWNAEGICEGRPEGLAPEQTHQNTRPVSILAIDELLLNTLSPRQTLSTFHYTLLDKCRALLSVVERGWPNALDFSLDLELNIPRMYYLMNNSFMECFVQHLMNCNCTCVRSTILRLTKLHSTKDRALDFTHQGGQMLSTFHSTCMSSVV